MGVILAECHSVATLYYPQKYVKKKKMVPTSCYNEKADCTDLIAEDILQNSVLSFVNSREIMVPSKVYSS